MASGTNSNEHKCSWYTTLIWVIWDESCWSLPPVPPNSHLTVCSYSCGFPQLLAHVVVILGSFGFLKHVNINPVNHEIKALNIKWWRIWPPSINITHMQDMQEIRLETCHTLKAPCFRYSHPFCPHKKTQLAGNHPKRRTDQARFPLDSLEGWGTCWIPFQPWLVLPIPGLWWYPKQKGPPRSCHFDADFTHWNSQHIHLTDLGIAKDWMMILDWVIESCRVESPFLEGRDREMLAFPFPWFGWYISCGCMKMDSWPKLHWYHGGLCYFVLLVWQWCVCVFLSLGLLFWQWRECGWCWWWFSKSHRMMYFQVTSSNDNDSYECQLD